MTEQVIPDDITVLPLAKPGHYWQLLKPRVMSLVIFTALVGIITADKLLDIHWSLAIISLLAIAVGAGASGALNMAYDSDIDNIMSRTQQRPIPQGHISRESAFEFGVILSFFSVLLLGLASNWLAAGLLAFTIIFYALIYTVWLKRWTVQNIVIGGLAGALPPVVGAAAVTGEITLSSLILCLIIFLWTPPHFWALSLLKAEDYQKAKVPVMPNQHGWATTGSNIFVYSLVLFLATILPFIIGFAGLFYLGVAIIIGGIFCWLCALLWWELRRLPPQNALPTHIAQLAKKTFAWSLLDLFLLFLALLIEAFL